MGAFAAFLTLYVVLGSPFLDCDSCTFPAMKEAVKRVVEEHFPLKKRPVHFHD